MKQEVTKYYCFAIITVVLWATAPAALKSMIVDLPTMWVLAVSGLLGAVFLALLIFVRGEGAKFKMYSPREYGRLAAMGFLGMFLYCSFYYIGIDRLTSQEACILNYLWPIMVVMFSCILLKEAMTARKVIAIILSFSGILVSTGYQVMTQAEGLSGSIEGILACLVAAVCYSLFSVFNKKYQMDQSIGMVVFWGVAGICALAVCLVTGEVYPLNLPQVGGMIWVGVAVHGIPYLLWAIAINGVENTARIANFAYLTPIISVIFSAITLHESLSPAYFAALALILLGIVIQLIPGRKPPVGEES